MSHSILWDVVFESGEAMEEYGTDQRDVREFIQRSFSHMGPIKSVTPREAEDGSEV